jgi:hypothetical protein
VSLTAADLAEPVRRAFEAPGPGWPGARHVSPDVLVAARTVDEIARGAFTLVLGEVHIGNTLLARYLIPHGPDGNDALMRACDLDLPEVRVAPVEARPLVTRADSMSWSARDFDLELGASKSWRPRGHVLRAADLVVEVEGDSLVVRDTTRDLSFDVIAFLEAYFTFMASNYFRPAPRGPHVPRVTIDGVVLCREQWRCAPEQLPFCGEGRGEQQFAAARAWARAAGVPRWVFAKIPEEPKPVYVDFDSPIYVEMFAKMMRKASSLTITEMLPSVEESWIPDAEAQTYTSELRMVAVDPVPWAKARES